MFRSLFASTVVLAVLAGFGIAADNKETQAQRRPSDLVYLLIEMSDCDEGCQGELQHIYDVLRTLDKNKDGKLDPNELAAMRHQLIEQRADHLIKRLDTNNDGKISRAEAKGQIKADFDRIDLNKDGFIDRGELVRAISEKPSMNLHNPRSGPTDSKSQRRPGGQ
jgi:Ca2+-binding EF-hand superfamily protein